jgi:hypothetical protein
MRALLVAKGLATWIPGVYGALFNRAAGAGTGSAPYCYGVWIKHLTLLCAHGMPGVPRRIVELGPGETLGTGIAGMLCGAETCLAVDKVRHLRPDANLAVFHGLAALLRERAPRPHAGFPPYDEYLDARPFPGTVLDEATLAAALEPGRVRRLQEAVAAVGEGRGTPTLRYESWDRLGPIAPGCADLVFSHVVMNQVDDLDGTYAACGEWVRPGGWMSHQVDFTSLGTEPEWNGHRAHSELAWKVIAGNRPYFVNREPLATHLALMERHGFGIVHVIRGRSSGGLAREDLAPRWRGMSDDDLTTRNAFVIARRR